jgi:hypothetical protein
MAASRLKGSMQLRGTSQGKAAALRRISAARLRRYLRTMPIKAATPSFTGTSISAARTDGSLYSSIST